jgi:hypothetical protein
MYGTYLCLGISVHDGRRAVVRAAAKKLRRGARADPKHRATRHRFYRRMLAYHEKAQELVAYWRL